jgi:alkylmercury lyase
MVTTHCCNDDHGPVVTASAAEQELAARGFVALWRGEQPMVTDLGGDSDTVEVMVGGGRLEVDATGRLVAVHGLAARTTPHSIEHDGRIVHTWCAFDAIGIPAALGVDADAVTRCPTCGRELRITLLGGRPIEDAAVRLWFPAGDCAHLVDDLCRHANLYCNDHHLTAAELGEHGQVLTVADAAVIGRVTWLDVARGAPAVEEEPT